MREAIGLLKTQRTMTVLLLIALLAACGGESPGPALDCAAASADPDMVYIEGGRFTMGDDRFYPEEGPPRERQVKGFRISRFEVTNRQFARFVEATGYVTEAERFRSQEDFPDLPAEYRQPGSMVFTPPENVHAAGSPAQWWRFVPGANWRAPEGPGSSLEGRRDHPVVHVSWNDAFAYARWLGHSLPTEAQWEYAARGGLEEAPYAWGEELKPEGRWLANAWQGIFPAFDTGEDGHKGIAPVGCFPPNRYGLHDMIGNVWEWTADSWSAAGNAGRNVVESAARTIKGGSHMCARTYCARYRPAARHQQEMNLGAGHLGFRTVKQ